ncbi:MAG: ABC transporter ATP-binding protein, partial [Lachnospiraceae bacterium]|nr:ABC transporter ATP-binding protein [Lachnospiraceae bacterium]
VQDKTAVYISHRMSSCRFCNNIFVFEDGRIVQKGSHDSLMLDEEGLYSKLWNAQAQYYQ